MIIQLAESLIDWVEEEQSSEAPQTLAAIQEMMVARVMGENHKNHTRAFAQRFRAKTKIGQGVFIKELHRFTRTNFPYKAQSFTKQKLKSPAVIFYQRSLGTGCKNLTYWLAKNIQHLGLKMSLNIVVHQSSQTGIYKFVDAHVYPAVWIGSKRIVLDGTLDFNQEVAKKKIKSKAEIICYDV